MKEAELQKCGQEKADIPDQNTLAAAVEAGKEEEKNGKQQHRAAEYLNQHRNQSQGGDPGAVAPARFDLLSGEPNSP